MFLVTLQMKQHKQKAKEQSRPGKEFVYAIVGIHSQRFLQFLALLLFKRFSSVNILITILHVIDPTGTYREETGLLLASLPLPRINMRPREINRVSLRSHV